MRERDREEAFEKFTKGVSALLGDENFREVMLELDAEGEEVASRLAPDPAAFLRQRGVRIPEDFRLSLETRLAGRDGGFCYCIVICYLWWCFWWCTCRFESVQRVGEMSTPLGARISVEIPAGARPIHAVGTQTAGFVGEVPST
jgi:hypothetical protein